MTIVAPTITPVTVDPVNIAFRANQDIQPFSYVSTMSYGEVLQNMRVWLYNTLVPYLNSNFEDVTDSWTANVSQIDAAINTALADQATTIDNALSAQQAQVAQELADAVASITNGTNSTLYDQQILEGLKVASSTSLAYLDSRYGAVALEPTLDSRYGAAALEPTLDQRYGVGALQATFDARYAGIGTQTKLNARPYIIPEDYVQSGDAGDWALAIQRAVNAAAAYKNSVLLGQMYACASTVTVPANASIVGLGRRTGLIGPLNAPIILLAATGVNNLHFEDFTVDGNANATQTKSGIRCVNIVNCTSVKYLGMNVKNTPDWGTTFNLCSDVLVRDYTFEAGVTSNASSAANAGRDGIHFLDCNDVLMDGGKGHSWDDFVGITQQTRNVNRITIRNITAVSEVAAVVTLGMETGGTGVITGVILDNINTYNSPDWYGGISSYVVKSRAQNGGKINNIVVSNVQGNGSLAGLWMDGVNGGDQSDVTLANIRVAAFNGHGIYLLNLTKVTGTNVFGQSNTANTDGIHMSYVQASEFHGGGSTSSGMWGLQMNGCVSVDIWGMLCRDNGALAFSTNNGGNLRVVNCTTCSIYGGQYVGAATVSYYGQSLASNTTLNTTSVPPTVGGAH